MCKICAKLTTMTPERREWRRSGVFNVNLTQMSHIVMVLHKGKCRLGTQMSHIVPVFHNGKCRLVNAENWYTVKALKIL